MICRLVEFAEQLLDPVVCSAVAFDFPLPSAGGGVFDELLLDGEAPV